MVFYYRVITVQHPWHEPSAPRGRNTDAGGHLAEVPHVAATVSFRHRLAINIRVSVHRALFSRRSSSKKLAEAYGHVSPVFDCFDIVKAATPENPVEFVRAHPIRVPPPFA